MQHRGCAEGGENRWVHRAGQDVQQAVCKHAQATARPDPCWEGEAGAGDPISRSPQLPVHHVCERENVVVAVDFLGDLIGHARALQYGRHMQLVHGTHGDRRHHPGQLPDRSQECPVWPHRGILRLSQQKALGHGATIARWPTACEYRESGNLLPSTGCHRWVVAACACAPGAWLASVRPAGTSSAYISR